MSFQLALVLPLLRMRHVHIRMMDQLLLPLMEVLEITPVFSGSEVA